MPAGFPSVMGSKAGLLWPDGIPGNINDLLLI